MGETAPLYSPDDTETERAANRRVEIRLIPYRAS
jgi:flagellar motor protein MotB